MLKNTLLLLIIATMPAMSFAENTLSTTDLERQIFRKANHLNRALDRNVEYMSRSEKIDILDHLEDLISEVQGESYHNGVIVKFAIESTGFVIESKGSLTSVFEACKAKLGSTSTGSADDISAEVSGTKKSKSRSGWWKTDVQKCQAVASLAAQAAADANKSISRKRYVLSGSADGVGIIAEGNNLEELSNSCLDLTSMGGNSVDDVSARLNDGPTKTRSRSGWWRSSEEVCQTAISLVF